VCQNLPFSSPQEIWNHHYLGRIHASGCLPSDYDNIVHDLRAEMLSMVSPKFPFAVKTLVRDWKAASRILEKGWKRWEYLKQDGEGFKEESSFECYSGVKYHEEKMCSWPYRLHNLLREMFGDVFVVSNVAAGGTNSAVGTGILLYDALADEIDQADIIINAYSTNDNTENQQEVFYMIQNSSRQALRPHPCKNIPAPLLIYLNDALGDDRDPIINTSVLPGVFDYFPITMVSGRFRTSMR
jgi:hypothetical protein